MGSEGYSECDDGIGPRAEKDDVTHLQVSGNIKGGVESHISIALKSQNRLKTYIITVYCHFLTVRHSIQNSDIGFTFCTKHIDTLIHI